MRLAIYYSVFHFSNSYLIGPDGPGDAVLIDPGVFDEGLLKIVEENGFYIRQVLVTHVHHGHVNGLKTIRKIYDSVTYCSDPERLEDQATRVAESEPLRCGEFSFRILETPGHSNDSICFLLGSLLFTGDTLSAGSIGKTSTAYERALLLSSVRRKILNIEEDLFVFPGHGPPTRLAVERAFNPYLEEKI